MATSTTERIQRLNRASERRVIDPDADLPGAIRDGQLIPDELLSVAGLDLGLSAEQKRVLSREEVASIFDAGIRFEAVLEAGFALQIAQADDLRDPFVTYLCHEIGEETRHQRIFQRVITQIAPTAVNPLAGKPLVQGLETRTNYWLFNNKLAFYVMVLAGEEIPDLMQKLASEHPDTDPFLAAVNRYHRQEEARHLSFARARLPEVCAQSSARERLIVRQLLPSAIKQLFAFMVHPGVYETVGLPGWQTWSAANRAPQRLALRQSATRPIAVALQDAGVLPGRLPRAWRELCGPSASAE